MRCTPSSNALAGRSDCSSGSIAGSDAWPSGSGPGGSVGAGVSVDYSGAAAPLTAIGYTSKSKSPFLTTTLGTTTDTGSRIENLNRPAWPAAALGIGLSAGASAQLGTITFHKDILINDTFEIRSDASGPTDGVLDIIGGDISSTTPW